jgi:hypothetical protein
MDGKASYIAAYDTKGKDSTINIEVGRLLAREDIQERIETLQKPIIKAAQTQAISEREKKKSIIWEEINNARSTGDHAAIARYMDILNKMDQEYIQINKDITDNKTNIEELDTDTLSKLIN